MGSVVFDMGALPRRTLLVRLYSAVAFDTALDPRCVQAEGLLQADSGQSPAHLDFANNSFWGAHAPLKPSYLGNRFKASAMSSTVGVS
jgi:hypothetical protein